MSTIAIDSIMFGPQFLTDLIEQPGYIGWFYSDDSHQKHMALMDDSFTYNYEALWSDVSDHEVDTTQNAAYTGPIDISHITQTIEDDDNDLSYSEYYPILISVTSDSLGPISGVMFTYQEDSSDTSACYNMAFIKFSSNLTISAGESLFVNPIKWLSY